MFGPVVVAGITRGISAISLNAVTFPRLEVVMFFIYFVGTLLLTPTAVSIYGDSILTYIVYAAVVVFIGIVAISIIAGILLGLGFLFHWKPIIDNL